MPSSWAVRTEWPLPAHHTAAGTSLEHALDSVRLAGSNGLYFVRQPRSTVPSQCALVAVYEGCIACEVRVLRPLWLALHLRRDVRVLKSKRNVPHLVYGCRVQYRSLFNN